MGYHVEIHKGDRDFIRRLRTTPSEVFGRPYAGYLLFLIGSSDTSALEWLQKHCVALDSLTGDHIAYAIFARKVPFRVEIDHDGAPRAARTVADVELPATQRLHEYLERRYPEKLADGDTLNAITYATDDIAKAFGILDRLPCIVVLDAFLTDEISIVELDDDALTSLFPTLRLLVHRLTEELSAVSFVAALESVARTTEQADNLLAEIASLQAQLELYPSIRDSLRAGSSGEFRRLIQRLEQLSRRQFPHALPEALGVKIKGYARTIAALNEFVTLEWPLTSDAECRLQDLIAKHVVRLAPDVTEIRDRQDVVDSIAALTSLQGSLINQIVQTLLMPLESVHDRLAHASTELETVRERGRMALRTCLSDEAPSLRKLLAGIAREKRLKVAAASVTQKAKDYLSGALDPKAIGHLLAGAIRTL